MYIYTIRRLVAKGRAQSSEGMSADTLKVGGQRACGGGCVKRKESNRYTRWLCACMPK